jgi:hypothetical protein
MSERKRVERSGKGQSLVCQRSLEIDAALFNRSIAADALG